MRSKGLVIVLALALWPLLAEPVTRDNFLMRDRTRLCRSLLGT